MKFVSQRQRAARRRRNRNLAAAAAGCGGLLLAVGWLLPVERVTTSRQTFASAPDAVWRVLTDLDGMPLWRSDVVALERLPGEGGKTVWREVGRRRSHVVEFAVADPPRLLVMQDTMSGQPARPTRSLELVGAPSGTTVTVTDRAAVRNPLLRLLVRILPLVSPAERFLRDLDYRLNASRRQVAIDAG